MLFSWTQNLTKESTEDCLFIEYRKDVWNVEKYFYSPFYKMIIISNKRRPS